MDLIGNLFGRIIVAGIQKKRTIVVQRGSIVSEILTILYKEGFISGYRIVGNYFEVFIKYYDNKPVLHKIKRFSTYGKKIYFSVPKIVKSFRKYEFVILSTTHGLMTKERALNLNMGGEILVKIN